MVKNKKEKILEEIKELISHGIAADNKKAKKLAMRKNIKLGELKKRFCQKCFEPLDKAKVRIKNDYKIVTCQNCGKIKRWKLS